MRGRIGIGLSLLAAAGFGWAGGRLISPAQAQVRFIAPPGPKPDSKEPRGYPIFAKLETLIQTKRVAKVAGDDELKALLLARYQAAVRKVQVYRSAYESGRISIDRVLSDLPQLRDSFLALSDEPADQIPMLEFCYEAAKYREEVELKKFEQLRMDLPSLEQATFDRIDAQIRLHKARGAVKKG